MLQWTARSRLFVLFFVLFFPFFCAAIEEPLEEEKEELVSRGQFGSSIRGPVASTFIGRIRKAKCCTFEHH